MEEYLNREVYLYFCVCPCCGMYFYMDEFPQYSNVDGDGYYMLLCDGCADLD